jgi:drug/metabolite transporter (DMT)-like permease
MNVTKEHHGLLYGVLAAFCLAISALLIKVATGVPTGTMLFFRFATGLFIFLPWLLRARLDFSLQHLGKHLIRDFGGIVSVFCFLYTLAHIPIVNAFSLANTMPLFIPFIVRFAMKTVLPKRRLVALGVGFLGVLFILRPFVHFDEVANYVGVFGGFSSALAMVYIRKLSKVETTQTIMLTYLIVASLVSLPVMIFNWEPIPNLTDWGCIIGVGIVSAFFQYALTKSFTHASASKASMVTYLGVVFGGFFGWLFFHEIPDLWSWIGVFLILLGGIFVLFDQSQAKKIE